MEESIEPVTETTVERAVRPPAHTTPQMALLMESTAVTAAPTAYHAVDFCVPVGPDFSLVNGLYTTQLSWLLRSINPLKGRVSKVK